MQQLELLVAMRMRTRQERLHRLITGRASLLVLERWTAHGRRPPQYTDEEFIKLAAGDGILIESWRVASPLRAVPHVICVHACASAPPGAPVTTVQQTSPQPARAAHLGATGKLRDSHRYVKPPRSGTKARVRSVKPMTSFSTPRRCQ